MAITLSAGGDTYTLPGGAIILNDKQDMRHAMVPIMGRRGVQVRNDGNSETPKQLSLSFVIRQTSSSTLATELNSFQSVVGRSGLMLLNDGTFARHCWCRMSSINVDRVRRNYHLGITLNLIVPDGTWFAALVGRNYGNDAAISEAAITSSDTSGTTIRFINHDHTGSAPIRPQFKFAVTGAAWATPEFTWYGRNLVKNSDFSQHTSGINAPDDWTFVAGTPTWVQHYGYEGHHGVILKGSSGTEDRLEQRIPLQDATQYTVSFHALRLDSAGGDSDLRIGWQWLQEDGSSAVTETVVTFTDIDELFHNRFENTQTSGNVSNPIAFLDLHFRSETNNHEYLITDIQLEQASAATEYQCTSDPRYKPVLVTRGGVSVPSGDDWTVDMWDGISRIWDGTDWANDGGNWNGKVFDLQPGMNHIYVSTPTGSVAVAATMHGRVLFY